MSHLNVLCCFFQRRQTCTQILHKKRTGSVFDGYDIALLILDEHSTKTPIRFSKNVKLRSDMRMTTMGFGGEDNGLSSELQKIDDLTYLPNTNCANPPELADKITETMLCALAGRKGPCRGMHFKCSHPIESCTDNEDGAGGCCVYLSRRMADQHVHIVT